MDKQIWIDRYKARIVEAFLAEDTDKDFLLEDAQDIADDEFEAMGYEELVVGYEEDPEGSADESLSYYEADYDIEDFL